MKKKNSKITPEDVKTIENFFQNWRVKGLIAAGIPGKECTWADNKEGFEQFLKDAKDNPIKICVCFEKRDKSSKASLKKRQRDYTMKDSIHKVILQEIKPVNDPLTYGVITLETSIEAGKIAIPGFLQGDDEK